MKKKSLNCAYRLIWNVSRSLWVVAGEHTKGKGKSKRAGVVAAAAIGAALSASATWADSCTTSSTTISTAITDTCTLDNGESVSLSNSGSIAGIAAGINVSSSNANSIDNSGIISGAAAIQNLSNSVIGSISNSNTISGTNFGIINNSSTITTLTNSGAISGLYGIFNNNGTITTLINTSSGTITGTGAGSTIGVANDNTFDTLTNSGTISSSGYGIHNNSGGTITTLTNTNSGTINGAARGVNNSGTIDTLTNSGTISGDEGIFNRSTITTLTNSGIISGNEGIYNGGGTITTLTNTSIGTISASYGIGNEGTITTLTNDGTISSTNSGIESDGTIDALINSGTISSSSGDGIYNNSGGTITTLTNTNSGTISGTDRGVVNAGTIDTLANSGTISSTNRGVVNDGTIDALTNSGTISGDYGIYNYPAGTINTLTNSGTISGGTYAINNLGTITNGIINTGMLDGAVYLDSTALYLNGASSRVTGAVTGDSASAVAVNGTFSTENTFDVGSFAIANGGTLNIAHGITTSSGFTNSGTLAIADATTATITGDYTQSADGVLAIGTSSASSHGVLNVSGTATFAADTGLVINVANTNTLANGNTLSGVVTAETLSASTFAITDNSALFNFTATVNGSQIDVTTHSNLTVLSSVEHHGPASAMGAASVLDTFVQGGTTGTDMDSVVTALGQLATEKEVANAAAETLPLMNAGLTQIASDGMRTINHAIQTRQGSFNGIASGDNYLSDKQLWLKPIAGRAEQDDHDGAAGYEVKSYGFVLGLDGEINQRNRLGFAVSYLRNDVDGQSTASGNNATIDAYQLIGYGSYALAPNTELSWQADIGKNQNNGERNISFIDRVAQADYDSTTAHVGIGISRLFAVSDNLKVVPALRANYSTIRDEAYTETGADALNLNVAKNTAEALVLSAESLLNYQLSNHVALIAEASVGYNTLSSENSLTASYVGGGTAFSTESIDSSPWLGKLGAGVVYSASETVQITVRYDAEARDTGYLGQTVSAKVRWAF